MKASREQLKSIMRELFIEILGEALGNIQSPMMHLAGNKSQQVEQRSQITQRKPKFDPRLDTPVRNNNRVVTDSLKEAIRVESRGNPIMADILADTASTTLASQLANGDRMGQPMVGTGVSVSAGSSPVQQEQFHGNPEEVFGSAAAPRADGMSHWADLAFAPSKKT